MATKRSVKATPGAATLGGWSSLARRFGIVGPVALLAPAMLFVFGPATIYFNNPGEIAVLFSELAVPWLLAIVAIVWMGLSAVGLFLSERLLRIYAACLFAIGILVWAQGNLWVGDYGAVDGREIDWDRLAWRDPYELGVWIVLLAAAAAFHRRLAGITSFASLLFLGLQAAALAVVAWQASPNREVLWQEPPEELYRFSSQQNVVHLVLDEFQSDVFAEIVANDRPWINRKFSGFVSFSDHMASFPTTSLAMPAMLTGQVYANDRPVPQFIREAFLERSIFSGLARNGYDVDVVSVLPATWLADWIPPDPEPGGLQPAFFGIPKPFVGLEDYRRFGARQLIEWSVFRHLPHRFKSALSTRPRWFESVFWKENLGSVAAERRHYSANSVAFFSDFIGRVTADRDRPVYKLLHLGLPHRPVELDESCSYVGVTKFSREVLLAQSRCTLEMVGEFFDRLRALGVYDTSLIIVSSDHGTGTPPLGFVPHRGSLLMDQGASTPGLLKIVASSKAVMAIKAPGSQGPLVLSDAPTTHTDLPGTVFDMLGLAHEFPGRSMFDIDAEMPRRRVYRMYDLDQRFPKLYLRRLDLLSIDGNLLDGASWSYQRSVLAPDLDLSAETIDLGSTAAVPYMGPGWSVSARRSDDESGERMSFSSLEGTQAVLFVSLPPDAVELNARVLWKRGTIRREIEVDVDGRVHGVWTPAAGFGYQTYSLEITSDAERPRVSTVTFRFVGPTSKGVNFDRVSFRPL